MMSEAYLRSRIEMRESDLPAWLMEGEFRGMGKAVILKDSGINGSEREPPRRSILHIPRRREARS